MTISNNRLTHIKSFIKDMTVDELNAVAALVGLSVMKDVIKESINEGNVDAVYDNNPASLTKMTSEYVCDIINPESIANVINSNRLADDFVCKIKAVAF